MSVAGISASRRAIAAAAVLVAAAAGFAYHSMRPAPSPLANAPVEKLRIAFPDLPHVSLLHIAAEKGYFAEEGLEVEVTRTTHGKLAVELVLQGKADLASAAEVPFVLQVLKGEALATAATIASGSGTHAIIARKDRGIVEPRDLIGKKVAVTLGTSGEYFRWAYFIRHKLPPQSVTLIDLLPGEIAPALARGTIDAAATWQPNVFQAQAALGADAVTFHEAHAYTETWVVVGRPDFLKAQPRAVEKLLRALLKAEAFHRSRAGESLQLVAGRLKVDARALETVWQDFNFRVDLQQSQIMTLEEQSQWAMERGYVERRAMPNFLPNLYLDALLAVLPERVTVVR